MPHLLEEDPMALLAPTNHPRIKCEKKQINNSVESILDEDVPYSIVVENILLKNKGICSKLLQCFFCFFYIYFIFNSEYPKKLEATFFIKSDSAIRCVL